MAADQHGPGKERLVTEGEAEVRLLRDMVRRMVGWREPQDRPWMRHSPMDEAYERAWEATDG